MGDKLREIYGSDILAKLAIAKISAERKKNFGEFDDIVNESSKGEASKIKNQKICHIIDSVKNSSELEIVEINLWKNDFLYRCIFPFRGKA